MVSGLLDDLAAWYGANLLLLVGFWAIVAFIALLEVIVPAYQSPDRTARWPTNVGLALMNAVLAPLAPLSAVAAAQWAAGHEIGLLNQISAPLWVAILVTLVVYSFGNYAVHVGMHKVPLLWRLHRIHHSDTRLDVSTGLRAHPLAFVVNGLASASIAVAFGLPAWIVVVYEIVESAASFATHANLRLPEAVDRRLRWIVVTPNMHTLHHSSHRPETDSNYSTVFSVWDRVFGTYRHQPVGGYEGLQHGLEDVRDARASSLWWQLKSPVL